MTLFSAAIGVGYEGEKLGGGSRAIARVRHPGLLQERFARHRNVERAANAAIFGIGLEKVLNEGVASRSVFLLTGRDQVATGVDLRRNDECENEPHAKHVRRAPKGCKTPTPHKEGKQCPA